MEFEHIATSVIEKVTGTTRATTTGRLIERTFFAKDLLGFPEKDLNFIEGLVRGQGNSCHQYEYHIYGDGTHQLLVNEMSGERIMSIITSPLGARERGVKLTFGDYARSTKIQKIELQRKSLGRWKVTEGNEHTNTLLLLAEMHVSALYNYLHRRANPDLYITL